MSVDQLIPARLRFSADRARIESVPRTALAVDLLVVAAATLTAALLRNHWSGFWGATDVALPERLGMYAPPMVLLWLAAIWLTDGYHRSVLEVGIDEYRRVALASMFTLGLMSAGCYLLKVPLSRAFLVLAFAIGVPSLLAGRYLIRRYLQGARLSGRFRHQVVIAGEAASVDDVARALRREPRLGYSLVGALLPSHDTAPEMTSGIPVLGGLADTCTSAIESGADTLFLAHGAVRSNEEMRSLVWELEDHDIQVVVAPNVSEVAGSRVRIRPVAGMPLVHIERPRGQNALKWGKRTFDVVVSSLLLLLASPLLVVSALQVKRFDGGPALFRQLRVGRDGVQFSCLKFRTMVMDAEERLARLHAEQGYEGGLFKMEDDPRITRPGRWMRRLSIDELPQLVNVLRGEMSLIGPRPPLPSEVEQYLPHAHRRLRVRPGLTGLWQVSGRSDLSFDDAIRLDLYYVDNWSIFADLSILFRTFGAVTRSRGAY